MLKRHCFFPQFVALSLVRNFCLLKRFYWWPNPWDEKVEILLQKKGTSWPSFQQPPTLHSNPSFQHSKESFHFKKHEHYIAFLKDLLAIGSPIFHFILPVFLKFLNYCLRWILLSYVPHIIIGQSLFESFQNQAAATIIKMCL